MSALSFKLSCFYFYPLKFLFVYLHTPQNLCVFLLLLYPALPLLHHRLYVQTTHALHLLPSPRLLMHLAVPLLHVGLVSFHVDKGGIVGCGFLFDGLSRLNVFVPCKLRPTSHYCRPYPIIKSNF